MVTQQCSQESISLSIGWASTPSTVAAVVLASMGGAMDSWDAGAWGYGQGLGADTRSKPGEGQLPERAVRWTNWHGLLRVLRNTVRVGTQGWIDCLQRCCW